MQNTLEIPDQLAAVLSGSGKELSRAALEAIGLEAYRQRRISGCQLRTLLGIPSRFELDAFLKEHQVCKYTIEDFEKDLASIREARQEQEAEKSA
jgi:hypothetical protein